MVSSGFTTATSWVITSSIFMPCLQGKGNRASHPRPTREQTPRRAVSRRNKKLSRWHSDRSAPDELRDHQQEHRARQPAQEDDAFPALAQDDFAAAGFIGRIGSGRHRRLSPFSQKE